MTHTFKGACECGSTTLNLQIPHPLKCYAPRACDCDFCVSRDINWLSDPNGQLNIASEKGLNGLQQGSNQAVFHACAQCQAVVVVTLESEGKLLGAINAKMLQDEALLKESQTVSPQQLSAERKVDRWSKIWMPVQIN